MNIAFNDGELDFLRKVFDDHMEYLLDEDKSTYNNHEIVINSLYRKLYGKPSDEKTQS